MKRTLRTASLLGVIASAVLLSGHLRVEKKSCPVAVSAAPAAAPEMARLKKFYLGDWQYTETYPKSPAAPQGGVNTGVYTSELGPGGNSLVNHFHSQGPVGDFEGLLIMT